MKFSRPITKNMSKKERYMLYFESLCRDMKLKHDWDSHYEDGKNRCRFLHRDDAGSFGLVVPVFSYSARFPRGDKEVETYLSIRHDHELFDHLRGLKSEIEADFGSTLDWQEPGAKKRAAITIRNGSIFATQHELEEYGEWHIEKLLKFNETFAPRIRKWFARSPLT